jgi:tRNA G18 (ribose-2'-O)-methylase SpoU
MVNIIHLQDLGDPRLDPYKTMKQQTDHEQRGLFVAEGEKVVRRLLETDIEVISVLLPPKWEMEFAELLRHRGAAVDLFIAEKHVLETLTGFSMYQGVLGLARIPSPTPLTELLAKIPPPYLLAAVDALSNADNLGSLVRNCAAFGVQGLIVGETCTNPYMRRAVRASMGNIFSMPFTREILLRESIVQLRSRGIRCLAAHPHGDIPLYECHSLGQSCCVVFGSEGYGISDAVLQACDEQVFIPMFQQVDSLNVGNSAAAFFCEAQRQRWVQQSCSTPVK